MNIHVDPRSYTLRVMCDDFLHAVERSEWVFSNLPPGYRLDQVKMRRNQSGAKYSLTCVLGYKDRREPFLESEQIVKFYAEL